MRARSIGSLRRQRRFGLLAGALAVVVVGLLSGLAGRRSSRASSVARHAPAVVRSSHPAVSAASPSPTAAAVEFARTYAAFLYGRASASDVQPDTASLRRVLGGGRAAATPAERDRQVVVSGLRVDRGGPGSASVTGLIDDGASPPYVLTFNLTLRRGRWEVAAVSGGGAR